MHLLESLYGTILRPMLVCKDTILLHISLISYFEFIYNVVLRFICILSTCQNLKHLHPTNKMAPINSDGGYEHFLPLLPCSERFLSKVS